MRYITILLLAALAVAQAGDKDQRRIAKVREVNLPWDGLAFKDGLTLAEGSRSLRDRFPYIVVTSEADRKQERGWMLTPRNLGRFLAKRIEDADTALAAARLFVPGPMVRTNAAAARVMQAARALPADMGVKVAANLPGHMPAVTRVKAPQGGVAWNVSFMALEIDARVRLVHAKATVEATGAMEIETTALVDGPQLSWQTAMMTPEEQKADERRRKAADAALLDLLKALELNATVDTAWALGRTLRRMDQVKAALGAPDRDWGTQAKMWQWVLTPDETLTFGSMRTDAENGPIDHVGYLKSTHHGNIRATRAFAFYSSGRQP